MRVLISTLTVFTLILCFLSHCIEGYNRCFECRSRGDLGTCKDPFLYSNATGAEKIAGVETVPCSSGWCNKILEAGANSFKDEEYGKATERRCMVRPPSDLEERCAPTILGNHQKVMMCFCQGDLCNAASSLSLSSLLLFLLPLSVILCYS